MFFFLGTIVSFKYQYTLQSFIAVSMVSDGMSPKMPGDEIITRYIFFFFNFHELILDWERNY